MAEKVWTDRGLAQSLQMTPTSIAEPTKDAAKRLRRSAREGLSLHSQLSASREGEGSLRGEGSGHAE